MNRILEFGKGLLGLFLFYFLQIFSINSLQTANPSVIILLTPLLRGHGKAGKFKIWRFL